MVAFYGTAAAFVAIAIACMMLPWRVLRVVLSVLSVALLGVSLTAIVSFISLYVYQLPTHHCPFDMFQSGYNWVGYLLYGSLFAATVFGLLPGVFVPIRALPGVGPMVHDSETRWLRWSILSAVIFLAVSSWPMVFGHMRLVGS